jgi:hypothetical protein
LRLGIQNHERQLRLHNFIKQRPNSSTFNKRKRKRSEPLEILGENYGKSGNVGIN